MGTALGDQGDGADLYSENITRILDKLLDGYDNRLRPGFGGSGEAPSPRGAGGWEGRAAALWLPQAGAARPAPVAGGRRWNPKRRGKAAKLPVPSSPRVWRDVSVALEPGGPAAPAPLCSQPLSVSRRLRDRSQDGHLRDQLRAGVRRGDGKGPTRRPCSLFPGFITVASELTVIKADYEA